MELDTIYTTLRNAGFIVSLSGMSFVVSLTNRAVTTMEVEQALGYPKGVCYGRVDNAVVVWA